MIFLSRRSPIEAFESIHILDEFTIEMNANYFSESYETILLYFIDPSKKKLLAVKHQAQMFFAFSNRLLTQNKNGQTQLVNAKQLLCSFIDDQQSSSNTDYSIMDIISPIELLDEKYVLDFNGK